MTVRDVPGLAEPRQIWALFLMKEGRKGRMSLNVARRFVSATGGVFYMYDVCGISVFVDRSEQHPDIMTVSYSR